jgi:uncharacterized iron-regulated protein
MLTRMYRLTVLFLSILLGACASLPAPVLIFGEQHDQPDQQRQVADTVQALAARGQLSAVVLEMAERGHDTRHLARDADEEQARAALAWTGWPWPAYAAVVMNAVRAGVPVLGGNAPKAQNRAAMTDETLDQRVADNVRQQIAEAVRSGHCGLLPASQEPGMVRIQIARDLSLANTLASALVNARPGQQVLLLTGAQHASRDRGVPLHLPPATTLSVVMFGSDSSDLQADEHRPAAYKPQPDPCIDLRRKLGA